MAITDPADLAAHLGDPGLLAVDFVDGLRGLLRHLAERRERLRATAAALDATEAAILAYLKLFEADWAARERMRGTPLVPVPREPARRGRPRRHPRSA